jgi:hypothetical protein
VARPQGAGVSQCDEALLNSSDGWRSDDADPRSVNEISHSGKWVGPSKNLIKKILKPCLVSVTNSVLLCSSYTLESGNHCR